MGEMSKLDAWSNDLQRHVGGFLMWCLVQLQDLRFFLTYFMTFFVCMVGDFWFFKRTLWQIIFMLLDAYISRSACFTDVTSTTITWNVVLVHILLRLLGIYNRSSSHQWPMDCMFSSENGSDIETVSNESEFFGGAFNIRNNDYVLVYCILKLAVASRWLHYRVNEFL
jgi:hypothetical protein